MLSCRGITISEHDNIAFLGIMISTIKLILVAPAYFKDYIKTLRAINVAEDAAWLGIGEFQSSFKVSIFQPFIFACVTRKAG